MNDTLSDYDGYFGTGPSRPVHAGIFISQGSATGTGELIRLNNIESQFLSPGKKWTISADATWYKSGLAGSHELQFGMLLQPSMVGVNTTHLHEQRLLPGGSRPDQPRTIPRRAIVPFHRRVYDVDSIVTADVDASDNAVYVQDSWRPNARMTINAGLRLDWIQSEDRQAGIQTQDSLEVGPRFGATYSLTSDR